VETDTGSEVLFEIVFMLLLALFVFVNVRGDVAIPSGKADGNDRVRPVPQDAVMVILDEQQKLTVQGEPVTEETLLSAVARQIHDENVPALYVHPAVRHGEARRIRLLLETKFTVLDAFTKEDQK
jgi:biopolymer transport protein ExbD